MIRYIRYTLFIINFIVKFYKPLALHVSGPKFNTCNLLYFFTRDKEHKIVRRQKKINLQSTRELNLDYYV